MIELYLNKILFTLTFVNSLDPGQDWQNVGPDLDQNCLTLMAFLKEFFEKDDFTKIKRQQNAWFFLSSMQSLKELNLFTLR